MKAGHQKLRSQPPSRQSGQDALKRLDALKEWTEEPARSSAEAIGAQPEEVKPELEPVSVVNSTPKPAQTPSKASKRSGVGDYPWQDASVVSSGLVKSMNFNIPMELYLKLKWLGDTTYNSNMTKIIIEALEEKTHKLLKERGIK